MVGGVIWVESRQSIRPQYWIAFGLIAAGSAGMSAWWGMRPFLSAMAFEVALPVIGHIHLSSVLLFDTGVYMLVIGATVLILVALAHQSLRFRRKPPVPAPSSVPSIKGEF
jgi:multicomponent K+:H+ antiporter subunit A